MEKTLKDTNMWDGSREDIEKYEKMERHHEELLKQEETIWRQSCGAMWLKEGDKNTIFFHNKASQRRKVNEIKKIKDDKGHWWRGEDNIERAFINYFSDLFASSNSSEIENTYQVVSDKLDNEMIAWCSAAFTMEDVHDAIFQMHPLKSPGPDGLLALFFQKF